MFSLEPKPQRELATTGWPVARMILSNCKDESHQSEATRIILERARITCRVCYGYGHGLNKCPTDLRMKKFALANRMAKRFFATYRA